MRTLRAPFSILALLLLLCVGASDSASAQRLLFQKGGSLFSADENGKQARLLFSLPEDTVIWSVSPDGRRIAWMTRLPGSAESEELSRTPADIVQQPVAVYISDPTGRRRKRLFATDTITDRLNRPAERIGITPADLPKWLSNPGDLARELETRDGWIPYSLSWSADSQTLYLGCYRLSPVVGPVAAALTVDATSGTAFVDGDGRWRSLAPILELDARGKFIVGVADPVLPEPPAKAPGYIPLYAVNLLVGSRYPLLTLNPDRDTVPPYGFARQPSLAPENRLIAFAAMPGNGLWVTDKWGKSYQQVAEGMVIRPRWTTDGKRVLFLLPRPGNGATGSALPVYDLYSVPVGAETGSAVLEAPTLVLQGVRWFDIVPN
ncbi:MAG: hypothetical protein OHK0029_10710 [Armatimonadaceae bacterium]